MTSEVFKFVLSGAVVMAILLVAWAFETFGWRAVRNAVAVALGMLMVWGILLTLSVGLVGR